MRRSRVLESLAKTYEAAVAGRTGTAKRDLVTSIEDLLKSAEALEGEYRALAEQDLADAQAAGILKLEPLHRRDHYTIGQVRFSHKDESKLYEQLDRQSPSQLRSAVEQQFSAARTFVVPDRWCIQWTAWCNRMIMAVQIGQSIQPFDRYPSDENAAILRLIPKLLAWEGESLVRFASCVLCGDSKTLERLAPIEREGELSEKLCGKLGRLLSDVTNGVLRSLDEVGIVPTPRFALFHGPVLLNFSAHSLDVSQLHGAFRLSKVDLERIRELTTDAARCITVENETTFHELVKLNSGEVLIQTSFPGSATLALLDRLPSTMQFWHFGDSDDAGFEILRVLREKSHRDFKPLHMEAGRGPSEQEALGRPEFCRWPFYRCTCQFCRFETFDAH
jgi:hypothetical protein